MRETRISVLRAGAALLLALGAGCGNSDHGSSTTTALGGVPFTTVGRALPTFVDTSRPTQSNGTYPGAPTRTLPCIVWYPGQAQGGQGGAETIPCLAGVAKDHRGGSDGCTVVADAPLDTSGAPYPLIVFSHGFGNSAAATASFSQALAQYGYIVVAPTFPLSQDNAPGGSSVNDLPAQAGDVGFLINVFLGEVAGIPAPFPGAISPDEIGAAGRSLGASTTLLATHDVKYLDPRIRASAPVSPGWVIQTALLGNDGYFTGITTPLLIIGGSADDTAPFPQNDQPPYDLANPPKILVDEIGQGHTPETPASNTALVAFFDVYLRGKTGELAIFDHLPGDNQVQKAL